MIHERVARCISITALLVMLVSITSGCALIDKFTKTDETEVGAASDGNETDIELDIEPESTDSSPVFGTDNLQSQENYEDIEEADADEINYNLSDDWNTTRSNLISYVYVYNALIKPNQNKAVSSFYNGTQESDKEKLDDALSYIRAMRKYNNSRTWDSEYVKDVQSDFNKYIDYLESCVDAYARKANGEDVDISEANTDYNRATRELINWRTSIYELSDPCELTIKISLQGIPDDAVVEDYKEID